ncbi:MAG: glycosyltransferase family 2 protein [Gammaproteobacteria bacterium]
MSGTREDTRSTFLDLNSRFSAMEPGPELSIIVPTFNERENIRELLRRLHACLDGIRWEVIFVDDDSPDGTARMIQELGMTDRRVRMLYRIGRRGLSTACIEGMLASTAPYLAVMDADMQHDERLLPDMLRVIQEEGFDIVVGSRYAAGGDTGDWNARRQNISRFATRLSAIVLKADLKDPMSGFFMLRREVVNETARNLSGIGFKILLDIFASAPRSLTFSELPYTFGSRVAGESKLDSMVAWEYVMLLLDKTIGRFVPVRFIPFALIGAFGVGVHMAGLAVLFKGFGLGFATSQSIATLVTMTCNFFMNNAFTYRDKRLKGWSLLRGLISFIAACSIGGAANVSIATYLFEGKITSWTWSAIAGVLISAAWNYAATAVYTWNKSSR